MESGCGFQDANGVPCGESAELTLAIGNRTAFIF